MDYLRQVQRGVDYIEANLDFDVDLTRVSKTAGISHWHFQRIFKALTGETLKTYVRSRRLAKSLGRLLGTDERIVEIAARAGYESQEAFTRAFKKAFAMTPHAYRKLGDKSLFLAKVQFDAGYLAHINKNISLEPVIYEQSAMTLVGMQTRFFGVDSEKNNLGDKLPPLWDRFLSRLPEIEGTKPGVCYGVVQQADENSDELQYHAAIEVQEATSDACAPQPDAMVRLVVPGATYARFTHRGEAKDIDRTVNYIYSTWLARSGKRHTYGPDLEIYGSGWMATGAESVMHYAIPVTE
ncbi:MAG: AraC family transcriptional regulator [Myxococcota bacterium]